MQTPGAAIVCARPAAVDAKFENGASRSSNESFRQLGGGPSAPGLPSESESAATVSTSLYTAGTSGFEAKSKSQPSLPAATTKVTFVFASVALQIARCMASVVPGHAD